MRYFDLHCDTITECYEKEKKLYNNNLHMSLERGDYLEKWIQVYAIWIPDTLRGKKAYKYYQDVYEYFKKEIEINKGRISFCTTAKEMKQAIEQGNKVSFLAIEGSAALGGEVKHVEEVYKQGVRCMTLTWNGHSEVGDGCMCKNAGGLTSFGEAVIEEMTRLGMFIDVSHLSESGFWDVVKLTEKPFIATHSNSQSIWGHKRNLTDKQFKVISERKGLVGMNFFPEFIKKGEEAAIEDLLPHIDHFLKLGGEDVIAMGSDFDGAAMPRNISGIQDVGKIETLLAQKYGQRIAQKICFENAYTFFLNNL